MGSMKRVETGGRLVVNHARDIGFVFGFDGETVSSVTHGDDCVL